MEAAISRWIPVEILEHGGFPAFISDEDGRVEYCNTLAADLMRRDLSDIRGQRCHELMQVRTSDGKLICREQCAVQSQTSRGGFHEIKAARLSMGGEPRAVVNLFTVAVSPPRGRRCAMLHVMKPVPEIATARETREQDCQQRPDRLELLTGRERDVLAELAEGKHTKAIAAELFINPTTVRNHVRSILSKLHVHSRIQAILVREGSVDRRAATAPEDPLVGS